MGPTSFRKDYRHHNTGEDNGDSHLKSLLIHHEVILPVTAGNRDVSVFSLLTGRVVARSDDR